MVWTISLEFSGSGNSGQVVRELSALGWFALTHGSDISRLDAYFPKNGTDEVAFVKRAIEVVGGHYPYLVSHDEDVAECLGATAMTDWLLGNCAAGFVVFTYGRQAEFRRKVFCFTEPGDATRFALRF